METTLHCQLCEWVIRGGTLVLLLIQESVGDCLEEGAI